MEHKVVEGGLEGAHVEVTYDRVQRPALHLVVQAAFSRHGDGGDVGRLGGRVGEKDGQHELLVALNMANGAFSLVSLSGRDVAPHLEMLCGTPFGQSTIMYHLEPHVARFPMLPFGSGLSP